MTQLLLYDIFKELNSDPRSTKLGPENYFLMLELLESYPEFTESFDDLVFACESLWMKSADQKPLFNAIFAKHYDNIIACIELLQSHLSGKKTASVARPETEHAQNGTSPEQPLNETKPVAGDAQGQAPGTETATREESPQDGFISVSISSVAQASGEKAVPVTDLTSTLPHSKKFLLDNEYFPVASRTLQQGWRTLVNKQRTGKYEDIDITGTIRVISREGILADFEYEKEQENLLTLFILIDQGGSMTASEAFGKELAESARSSLVHTTTRPLYFYNIPLEAPNPDHGFDLFNENRTAKYTTFSLFKSLSKKNIVAMIYSDAGAIKGNMRMREERFLQTKAFLNHLLQKTAYTVWLNPAPVFRWVGTAAELIVQQIPEVPMFEANRSGIEQAISAMKGKIIIKGNHNVVLV